MPAGHLVRLGLLSLKDNCSQWIIGHWTATLGECLPTRNNSSKLQVIQKDLVMIRGHDIHRWIMCSICILFCAIIACAAFFNALFVSHSHSTWSTYLSERKEASSVCYDIKREGFKEYINDAFFVCVCVFFLFLVLLLDFFCCSK